MDKWIGLIPDEDIERIANLFLKEQLYNRFEKDIQRKLAEYTFYNKDIKYITMFLKSYILGRPKDTDTEKKEE